MAYEGDKPVYTALVATGLPGTPTVQGIFRTWWRLESRRMAGGSGAGYYYLEEVTWTCYFHGGYALHTAYWHDAFGRPRSHGCVNLSPYDAWWLFQWSAPGGANSPAVYVILVITMPTTAPAALAVLSYASLRVVSNCAPSEQPSSASNVIKHRTIFWYSLSGLKLRPWIRCLTGFAHCIRTLRLLSKSLRMMKRCLTNM